MSEQEVFDTLRYQVKVDLFGTRRYYNGAGQFHRTDGPAMVYPNGNKSWYQNGRLHRTDGPAVEFSSGTKVWYQNGQLHRTDGAAVEYADGRKEWYINDVELTKDEYNRVVKQYV